MTLRCSDVCYEVAERLRMAGFEVNPGSSEDHEGIFNALRDASIVSDDFIAAVKGVILLWDKSDLAEAVNEMRRLYEEHFGPIEKAKDE